MQSDKLLVHFNYIKALAESKCNLLEDAEDITSETFLAAYSFIERGGVIEHPKSWLANTLMHKYNDLLRRKYSQPTIISLDNIDPPDSTELLDSEEYSALRYELICLSKQTRDIMIRFYYRGQSIETIASQLSIPIGTVKSCLFSGRQKIKKELDNMKPIENNLPQTLCLSISGSEKLLGKPTSLVENDLIAQNLLILAYNKPLTLPELSRAIGIPTIYLEPIAERLTDGELMKMTDGSRYYTDFVIYRPSDSLKRFKAQLDFTKKHFERVWSIISELTASLSPLVARLKLNDRQIEKLGRYAILDSLQCFVLRGGNMPPISYPLRRDGGKWVASATVFPSGYDFTEYNRSLDYTVWGGKRCHSAFGTAWLYEFDTSLWDSPHRFNACGFENYFNHICELLSVIHLKKPLEDSGIPDTMLEALPGLEEIGLLHKNERGFEVDIPVLSRADFSELEAAIRETFKRLDESLGEEYRVFLKNCALELPQHLKSVPEVFRYVPATNYLIMSFVRTAYERGLHLSGVDYCCPPAIFICE